MKIKILIAALVVSLAMPVAAQFRPITEGYECVLSDVRLPSGDRGTIAYKPCSNCDYKTNRLAKDVSWELDGNALKLDEFRKHISLVRDRKNQTVTVERHLESNLIIRVSIYVLEAK